MNSREAVLRSAGWQAICFGYLLFPGQPGCLSALKWIASKRRGGTGPRGGYQAGSGGHSGMTGSHGNVNFSDGPRGSKFPDRHSPRGFSSLKLRLLK